MSNAQVVVRNNKEDNMSMRNLVPSEFRRRSPVRRVDERGISSFHQELNRLFDSFFRDAGLSSRWEGDWETAGGFVPRVNVSETDTDVKVVAELPGMDEKDVSVEVLDQALAIRGERKEAEEDKRANWYRVEHRYGSFERLVPLPADVDAARAKAAFKQGILTVALPKRPETESKTKRIPITTG